jgi:hypothetical protein
MTNYCEYIAEIHGIGEILKKQPSRKTCKQLIIKADTLIFTASNQCAQQSLLSGMPQTGFTSTSLTVSHAARHTRTAPASIDSEIGTRRRIPDYIRKPEAPFRDRTASYYCTARAPSKMVI